MRPCYGGIKGQMLFLARVRQPHEIFKCFQFGGQNKPWPLTSENPALWGQEMGAVFRELWEQGPTSFSLAVTEIGKPGWKDAGDIWEKRALSSGWLWVIPSWSGHEHGLWSQKAWVELPVFDSLNQLCDISSIALPL